MAENGPTPPVTSYAMSSLIRFGEHDYRVEAFDPSGALSLRDEDSGEVVQLDPHEIAPGPDAFRGDLSQVSDQEIARAMRRYALLSPYIDHSLTASDVEALVDALAVGRSQIFADVQKLRRAPHFTTLIRTRPGRKSGSRYLRKEVEEVLDRQVELAVRANLPLTVKTIFEETEADCDVMGFHAPCRKTVRDRIEKAGSELLLRRKHGIRRARERTTPMPGKIPVVEPLHDVEVDHSPLDMFLVSTKDRVCIGRAYLTVVIDTFSRGIMGFNLSLEPPSALTVALALTHAVLPKVVWLSMRGLSDMDWPLYGLMKRIRVDNASEFRSPAFEEACRKWGIEVCYRNKKEDGAIVERFIGTVQNWCSQEPGASGNDPKKLRGERDRREFAHMTIAEAEIWLTRQIIMRYHLECHSSLRMSPLQAWRAGLIALNEPRALVTNEDLFFISFLPSIYRVINHDGVRLFTETYFSPEARAFVKPGIKRKIYYDPRCMGRAYVDIGGNVGYIEIHYTDPSSERLPKAELEAARKYTKEKNPSMFSTPQRVALVLENRKARAKSQGSTRAARRKENIERAQQLIAPKPIVPDDFIGASPELEKELAMPLRLWSEGPV